MLRACVVCLMICMIFPIATHAKPIPPSFADLVERLSPAVVNVSTTQKVKSSQGVQFHFEGVPNTPEFEPFREFFKQFGGPMPRGLSPNETPARKATSLGSGFIIDADGYVVTNNHVIAKADEVTVTLHDDTKFPAKVVGRDAKTDLALLKIESPKPLPFISFGDSDHMRVGDWVIAIGNPFGLGGSVSAGIVSARSRNINAGPFDDFIQTDAAINRGNSGGPLFNINGEVIGVNSAIFSPTGGNVGIGFSIPSALAEPVLKQLREFGRTHRGWLGVKIQYVTPEIAESLGLKEPQGALVLEVNKDSPAEKSGIKAGDVILSLDSKPIKEMRNLPRLVAETKIGKKVMVEVWRKGSKKTIPLILGELDEDQQVATHQPDTSNKPNEKGSEVAGFSVLPLTDELRAKLNINPKIQGVLVTAVKQGTPAGRSGVQRMDVLVEINQQPITDAQTLKRVLAVAKSQGKKYALLRVLRGNTLAFITMETH